MKTPQEIKERMEFSPIFFLLITSLLSNLSIAIDTITSIQPLTINQTIISSNEIFELGFFNLSPSINWYVGIWYKNTPEKTIVWVANRDNPLKNPFGILTISEDGNIVILDEGKNLIWSSNQSRASNTIAQLLDSGNFVLRDELDFDPQNYLWQGFDHPIDTLLPGMKLGWDAKSGINRQITSWTSRNDPSSGENRFVLNINTTFPECYLMNGESILYRSGPWNGVGFSGVPEMKPHGDISFTFVKNRDEVYYRFDIFNSSLYSRLVVNYSGSLQRYTWINTLEVWNLFWYARKDQCDSFKECGNFGICDTDSSPVCKCMKGFQPKNPQAWNLRDGSSGCVRVHKLDCEKDGFLTLQGMKLPESINVFVDESLTLEDCKQLCLKNCSCTAYANSNITGTGSGCAIWSSDLVDLRQYAVPDGGQILFVRVPAGDSDSLGISDSRNASGSGKTKRTAMIAGTTVGSIAVVLFLSLCFIWRKKPSNTNKNKIDHRVSRERSQTIISTAMLSRRESIGETSTEEVELPLFDFNTIAVATDYFNDKNKLGQGGFGIVYKGLLFEGQEVAVKRLSKSSCQGIEEFKNEVKLIARLQHRNLVRLIGCCVDMEEKILIYEYMVHKSLDSILFDKKKNMMLNWQKRFNIICGIARGLLYLHQDSRFRIIHRDLKASNILLDIEMNPKISDFGMARIFSVDQIQANTNRIVGTYGYMAPEYAMDGVFSEKSDVFSFGVLVLEIVSGTKNKGFYHVNNHLNLLAYAWRLWMEGKIQELTDSTAGEIHSPDDLIRCIQVGLLCVQEHAEERPNMANVVLMLSSGSAPLPQPKHPGFSLGRKLKETDSSSNKLDESCTVNQVTVTMLDPR